MRSLLSIVLFLAFSNIGNSQSEEIGVFGGGAYYLGEMNHGQQFYKAHFAPGLLYRYNLQDKRWVLRVHFSYTKLEGSDADSEIQSNIDRNLNFQSTIIEAGPIMELNFIEYEIGGRTKFGNKNKNNGTAYIFGGINFFHMNPTGTLDGVEIELQPLGTEGQGSSQNSKKRYNLNQVSIPFGLGIKFNIGNRFALSMEYGLRKTFTDYIDDVSGTYVDPDILATENGILSAQMANKSIDGVISTGQQRGNSSNKDWYVIAGAILSYRLKKATTCRKW